jgi:aminoglycoside/choline kinase family phosphotransferase
MTNRALEIVEFLTRAGWDNAQQTPLRADFSTRHFARLERGDKHAVLMDADNDQKTAAFVKIAGLLRDLDLSAPKIYAADAARGFVLMEDFGDRNMGRMLDEGAAAKPLYRRAADVLAHLHQKFEPAAARGLDLPIFSGALFAAQAELFLDAWFVFAKQREATRDEAESFRAAWKEALKGIDAVPQTLLLRDFMPDNLTELEGRAEWRSVGLLDFQDGGIGPIAYDLASLCEAVRRDPPAGVLDELIDYYHERAAPKLAKNDLRRACRVLAAQRHMRVLGILANRALKTGDREKLSYAPRIWDYLGELLQDEALKPVREWVTGIFGH